MEHQDVRIVIVTPEDAEDLLAIYAPYVENTAITFEYEVPMTQEFGERIHRTLRRYPYLAAKTGDEFVGYAYAGVFHDRAAYDWAVETSIYVAGDKKKLGIGRKLHEALEEVLREQGILNMNACISCPVVEDEYLTRNSIEFHEHLGYRLVGEFRQCGYKFHRWYNMVWMEKWIGEHCKEQAQPKTFDQVRDVVREKYGIR